MQKNLHSDQRAGQSSDVYIVWIKIHEKSQETVAATWCKYMCVSVGFCEYLCIIVHILNLI